MRAAAPMQQLCGGRDVATGEEEGEEASRATAEELEEWLGEQPPQRRGRGNVVKGDKDNVGGVGGGGGGGGGDWLEDGEMLIRVVGEEKTVNKQ